MALFQRRHYNAIAAVFRQEADKWGVPPDDIYLSLDALTDLFQDDNPNFDRDRFVQACEESEVSNG